MALSKDSACSICLSLALLLARVAALEQLRLPFWPMKNGNSRRTGQAEHAAPFNLSRPAWVWEEPDRPRTNTVEAMHTSPTLDADKNTYISTTTGRVFAINENGTQIWNYTSTGTNCGNLALQDGTLFGAADDGFAYALDAATGRELWRTHIPEGVPTDSYSPLVTHGLVVLPACTDALCSGSRDGSDLVVALSVEDGSERWRYELPAGLKGYNLMPAEFEDSIVFPDQAGGLYRLLALNGSEVWRVPPPEGRENTSTTGGLAFGPDSTVYVGSANQTYDFAFSHPNETAGLLTAFQLKDGAQLWRRDVDGGPVNAAPAVGKVFGHDDVVALIVAVGTNPGTPGFQVAGRVEARNARTGSVLWSFHPGETESYWCAGFERDDPCYPDLFGNPSIGADGTVYVNWSGGWAFALKDANGDGVVDPSDPAEVSGFFHDGGTNGQSAIAPGILVAPSCWKLFGFVDMEPPVDPLVVEDTLFVAAMACGILAVLLVIGFVCYCCNMEDLKEAKEAKEAEDSIREASLQPIR